MAKRFTDNQKWQDLWFMDLPSKYKLFWLYLLDACNHAGIWKVNFRVAVFMVGEHLEPSEVKRHLKDRTKVINDKYWFVPKFVRFQYPKGLKATVQPQKAVINELEKYNIKLTEVYPNLPKNKQLGNSMDTVQDTDIDIDKDKDKDIHIAFEKIWGRYPRKKGKENARIHFKAQVKTPEDIIKINKALDNYIAEIKRNGTEEVYIKNGSTWFNGYWRDDVDYIPPTIKSEKHNPEPSCYKKLN